MSGQALLVGLLVAIAGTVILGLAGGIILAALLSLAWQAWRVEQEERLVRAFLGLARELVRHYDTLVVPCRRTRPRHARGSETRGRYWSVCAARGT